MFSNCLILLQIKDTRKKAILLYLTNCVRLLAASSSITWHVSSQHLLRFGCLLPGYEAPVAQTLSFFSPFLSLYVWNSLLSSPLPSVLTRSGGVCPVIYLRWPALMLYQWTLFEPLLSLPPLLQGPSLPPCSWQPLCHLLTVGLWLRNFTKKKQKNSCCPILLLPLTFFEFHFPVMWICLDED